MTFSVSDLDRLVDAMSRYGIIALDLTCDDGQLVLKLPIAQSVTSPKIAHTLIVTANSPAMGLFVCRGVEDGLDPLPIEAWVEKGEILGHVATGMLRLPVTSPASGRLTQDIPTPGRITGFGDALFSIEANS